MLNDIIKNTEYILNIKLLDLSLGFYILFVLSFLFIFLINQFFAKIIVSKIAKIVRKTGTKIDDQLFDSLIPPLKFLPIVILFYILNIFLNENFVLISYLEKINITLTSIFIFWFLYRSLIPLSIFFKKLENILSKALVSWIVNSISYLIIFLGIVAILETWGIKIGPIIAGLGLLGVAVALGAQDLFKNLISGIMILMEKRFHIGDVINLPGHTEGTVEHIGFRSTLIRKFDSTPISIPNYIFAEAPLLNYSNRTNRRINWIVGLEYNSKLEQIKNFTDNISMYIENSEDFIVNENFKSFVRLDKFNDSSIDILIYCFTSTNDWESFLKIKENLAIKIKQEVENLNLGFAFPSQSIYIENLKAENKSLL